MPTPSPSETIARGEDLLNLLDHIAWTDTIVPELTTLRDHYQRLLVASVLGQRMTIQTPVGPSEVTSEQLAGRIEGITFIQALFEKILRKGRKAFVDLNSTESTLQ